MTEITEKIESVEKRSNGELREIPFESMEKYNKLFDGGVTQEEKSNLSEKVAKKNEPVNGGSYREVKLNSGERYEVHHMPADCVSHLDRDDGPAIKMDKADHRQTASCGSSREAREYREHQKNLINSDNFIGAIQMNIDDIHSKFGNKYDKEISQMYDYVCKLKEGGRI